MECGGLPPLSNAKLFRTNWKPEASFGKQSAGKPAQSKTVMLSEILKLLKERGPMSLKELALHFQCDVPAMEGMLETLERMGRIQRLDTKCSKCKGCVEVKPEDAAIFQITGK